jgi:hypothetical protein
MDTVTSDAEEYRLQQASELMREAGIGEGPSEPEAPVPQRAVHPLAASFPMMDEEELNALADDIRSNGQMNPIVLDLAGQIIDGRNRLRACELAGVTPSFTTTDADPIAYILGANVNRRHLTKSQCAMAYAMAYPTPPTAQERGQQGGRGQKKTSPTELGSFSPELVRQARFVLNHSSDLAAKVMAGSSLGEAYKLADQQRREQEEYEQLRRDATDRLDAVADVCARLKSNIDRAESTFVDQGDFLKQVRLDGQEMIELAKQLADM